MSCEYMPYQNPTVWELRSLCREERDRSFSSVCHISNGHVRVFLIIVLLLHQFLMLFV